MIQVKLVSSLEKPFPGDSLDAFDALASVRMMRNQRLSVQLLYTASGADAPVRSLLKVQVDGVPEGAVRLRTVELVPVSLPAFCADDGNYLSTRPGLYPDLLQPLHFYGAVPVLKDQLRALWVEIDPAGALPAGRRALTVRLTDGGDTAAEASLSLEVLDAFLPPQEMIVTQWFHCDCLANYYDCEPWSERHWAIVEQFARTARRNGINMILTPLFTPPLDTAVGGERRTVQLLDVTVTDGSYAFDFGKVDRWIDMCDRVGIPYLEIAHFFTQWGAEHAPKVMATVRDTAAGTSEYRRVFGWETDAAEGAYPRFLRAALSAFLTHMRARGDDRRCYFHLSDEPWEGCLDQYRRAKAVVEDLLRDYPVMDALSDFGFYKQGLVGTPIPANDHVHAFLEGGVQHPWTYYCCGQGVDVSNRFIAMPACRTRSIGMQFYKYGIAGFLQWGYNFYSNMNSIDPINPYLDTCGESTWPGGDPFSVYPAADGSALESTRIVVFHEALQDVRAMRLCASFYGKERVVGEMERIFGEIRFDRCARSSAMMLAVRARIDEMIAEALDRKG